MRKNISNVEKENLLKDSFRSLYEKDIKVTSIDLLFSLIAHCILIVLFLFAILFIIYITKIIAKQLMW